MQLGVFSPINRLHSSSNPFSGKEPWNLNFEAEKIAGDWLRLRHALFPYLYAMNYRNHRELLPIDQPMYYSHPEEDEAYEARNQYWFGSELMVCPITEKNDPVCRRGKTKVWFPKGVWIDFFNGLLYRGDCVRNVYRSLAQMPVFARAGAIIPMENDKSDNTLGRQEELTLLVFPGADNTFAFMEDEGDGDPEGRSVRTQCSLKWGSPVEFTVTSEGTHEILPEHRKWKIAFRGFSKELTISANINHRPAKTEIVYEKETATTTVMIEAAPADRIDVVLESETGYFTDNVHANDMVFDLLLHAQMGSHAKKRMWQEGMGKYRHKLFHVYTDEAYQAVGSAMEELLSLLQL